MAEDSSKNPENPSGDFRDPPSQLEPSTNEIENNTDIREQDLHQERPQTPQVEIDQANESEIEKETVSDLRTTEIGAKLTDLALPDSEARTSEISSSIDKDEGSIENADLPKEDDAGTSIETSTEVAETPSEMPNDSTNNASDATNDQNGDENIANDTIENGADLQSPPVPEKDPVVQAGEAVPSVDVAEVDVHYNARLENVQIFQKAFTEIAESKEVKKNEALLLAVQKALELLKNSDGQGVHIIFDSLKVLCDSGSQDLKSKAVDIFAKLFDYAIFEDELDRATLTDGAIDVISSCFEGEGTDEKLEVQVVKALVQSILSMPTHGASLLKAVRQIFNVTILSLSQDNQGLAQGSLTQVVGAVFQRVNEAAQRNKNKSSRASARDLTSALDADVSSDTLNGESSDKNNDTGEKLTLEKLRNLASDSADVERANEASAALEKDEDLAVKDAFLIFRVICKLASKDLDLDSVDMKLHAARQKLLTLHLIHTILKDNIDIFISRDVVLLSSKSEKHTRLVDAIRPSLLQALSRNASSSLAPVFELSIEIFWLLVANLRSDFKKEISIFFETIYFPIGEIKTSTPHHKRYLLAVIERLCNDSRCLIEFYLNYDCVSKMPDICDMLINYLTKLALVRVDVTLTQQLAYRERRRQGIVLYDVSKIGELNSARVASRPPEPDVYQYFPLDYALKVTALNCFVAFLRSLHSWTQKGTSPLKHALSHQSLTQFNSPGGSRDTSRNTSFIGTASTPQTAIEENDDFEQFESQRQRKKLFAEGVRRFTQKPHKAIKYFIENGFLATDSVEDIASFLRENDSLDKAAVGEYLSGEKDGALRHAFFSKSNFAGLSFVDALRSFLQLFRLPGEGQKVDRFMLNFAERYVEGNPGVFETANAAYYLAYSTTMLNTDQHSKSLKTRMTLEDFVRMNEGCEDNLPRELSEEIFNEVHTNEIKLLSEQSAAAILNDPTAAGAGASVGFFSGRDVAREAYNHASREMSSKTEMLVRSLGKRTRSGADDAELYHVALNIIQVKAIFNQVWMSVLAGLTGAFKEYDDVDVVRACLEGLKNAIKIACLFDLDDSKKSFVNALIQFQNLANIDDIRAKNVLAVYVTLDLAVSEGNHLHNLWYAVLALISQLERLQLIANGIDQDSIPDVSTAKVVSRASTDASSGGASRLSGFFGFSRETSAAETAAIKYQNQHLSAELAALIGQTELSVAMDRVYTNTSELSGDAIKDFVTALRQVVSEEIESSGVAQNPRLFSLQKVVDICYYNMGRVRFEWSPLWAILGDIFNTVGCHANLIIDVFALDSLKQLSLRFLSLEELAHFKFQKEFLKPFHHIIVNNNSTEVKEMVIDCINNMVLAKADQIRSGWKTIFEVLTAAAKERSDSIVRKSFEMAVRIKNDYLGEVRTQDSFGDLVACFTEFAKNEKFQKYGLLSVEILTKLLVQIAKDTVDNETKELESLDVELNGMKDSAKEGEELSASAQRKDNLPHTETLTKLWFPILFGFFDIIMRGEELEVRLKTLTRFFDVLHRYGDHFEGEFWNVVFNELIAPIFAVIAQPWTLTCEDKINVSDNDRMSFWVSTTLVQALNSLVSLHTHYFDALEGLHPQLLGLLTNCICQANDTIAKTGKICLVDYVLNNSERFSPKEWTLIVDTFSNLFDLTTAKGLFQDPAEEPEKDSENRDHFKAKLVLQCILHLMLIDTVLEITKVDKLNASIPDTELIRLSHLLYSSYEFAHSFNNNYDLRRRIWDAGIIDRLPTLLKQETTAAAVFLNVMFNLYCDDHRAVEESTKDTILTSVVPLCNNIVTRYSNYEGSNVPAYLLAWRLVIKEIFEGYVEMDDQDFVKHAPQLFKVAMLANNRSAHSDTQKAVMAFMARVGDVFVYKS